MTVPPSRPAGARRLATLLALLVALVAPLLTSSPASAASGLTTDQEHTVLRLVDDVCGDTWCEGDFSFQFRSFTCQQGRASCRLTVRIAPYSDDAPRWRTRSGTVRGFTTFDQMVRTSDNGGQSLQPDFSAAVGHVITGVEARTQPAPVGR